MVSVPRGTVTLLLADIEGSTKLWEQRPDEMAAAIARLDPVVNDTIAASRGVRPVEQGEGDSFVAAFSEAGDAVACALALQLEFARADAPWPFRVRMALHVGDVQLRDEGNYVGATIARCARLRSLASGGQTLVSQAVHDITADRLPDGASYDDLGTHRLRDLSRPERVFQLCHDDLPVSTAPLRSLDAVANNLPIELTSFVGRDDDIDAVAELLRSDRLVTLLGTGGCGKTRLSLQVGARMVDDFPDGVWFVELAPLEDGRLVAQAVADSLGVRAEPGAAMIDAAADGIGSRRVALILDNCEHVIPEAAAVAHGVLRRCRNATILATSREPLGVPGELTYSVPSLDVDEAVQLFVDRAALAGVQFGGDDAGLIAEICRALDGMPLAIELAAARVRSLTLEQIRDGLADRFRLLTGGARTLTRRQQTLRASVDWSFDLLTDPERVALRRLSVFAGGFDLMGAEAALVGDDVEPPDVVDLVTSLVDKSLVVFDADRYRMLETIRQYGHERLAEAGEVGDAHGRLRRHCLELLRRAAAEEEGPDQQVWLMRVRREFDNIRAALNTAYEEGDGPALLELTCLAGNTWTLSGQSTEHRDWLHRALELAPADSPHYASGLYQLGVTDGFYGDLDSAIDNIGASIPLYRAEGDEHGALWALAEYAWNLTLRRGLAAGRPAYEEGIAQARQTGEMGALTSLEYGLSSCLLYASHYDEAVRVAEAALSHPSSVEHFVRWTQITLGGALAQLGRVYEGIAIVQKAVDESHAVGDTVTANIGGWMLANALALAGRADECGPLVEQSFETARGFGTVIAAPTHATAALVAVVQGDVAAALDEATRAVDMAAGVSDSWVAMFSLTKAEAEFAAGDDAAARATLEAVIALSRKADFPGYLASGLVALGHVAFESDDVGDAASLAYEAMATSRPMGHEIGLVDSLELLAVTLAADDRHEDAIRLWGAADAARTTGGYRLRWPRRPTLDAAAAGGAALTIDEACDYATRGRGERKRPTSGWEALSPTEQKVAALVAEGLTNAQVGERLFVSRHTVDTHLRHIYGKLGISSRAELASQLARRIP